MRFALQRLAACLVLAAPAAAAENLLADAKWQYSTDRGTTWSPTAPTAEAGAVTNVLAQTTFEAGDLSAYRFLELTHGMLPSAVSLIELNGQRVPVPLEAMRYRTVPAIPIRLLVEGVNRLHVRASYDNRSDNGEDRRAVALLVAPARLMPIAPTELKFQTPPILGAVQGNYMTVTCRTRIPAAVTLSVRRGKAEQFTPMARSAPGLMHRLRARVAPPKPGDAYVLIADNGDARVQTDTYPLPPRPTDESLRFVALGDSRTNPDDWSAVAGAVAAIRPAPHLMVHTGDMVARGRNDWQWDEQFVAPARRLLATVPLYPVIGNHEEQAPLIDRLFYTPSKDGTARDWWQEIAGVLLIGIDGRGDWSPDGTNARWLESVLAASRARFIFLFSHYPAWSSSKHARLDPKTGKPAERSVRQARQVILPLLARYNATAMIAGHDHCYERSEPPGGVTHIITGGAGAPRHGPVPDAREQNPHSKTFAARLHYCLFEVAEKTCTMKAVTPEGQFLDAVTWKARFVPR